MLCFHVSFFDLLVDPEMARDGWETSFLGDLWLWLQLMWLQFEVVRGSVAVRLGSIWGRFGAFWAPSRPQIDPRRPRPDLGQFQIAAT